MCQLQAMLAKYDFENLPQKQKKYNNKKRVYVALNLERERFYLKPRRGGTAP